MLRTTLRSLQARKLRLFTTTLAVVLGVAFMAGTLVFTDTIGQTFDRLFATVSAGTDAHVRSAASFSLGEGGGEQRSRLEAATLDVVLGVEGVAAAEGEIEGYAQIVGADGDPVGNPAGGSPSFGRSWGFDETLNPFDLAAGGRAPSADDEVVIDAFTASQGSLDVGDRTTVLTQTGVTDVEVVGIARFGDTDSPGGSTNVLFTAAAAQRLVAEEGRFDAINVRADEGISEAAIRDAIAAEVAEVAGSGGEVEVLTGAEVTKEDQDTIAEGLGVFRNFLVAFAAIALFVGVFIIYNTFNTLIAQRTQEMALLRAVGASRRQVMASVVVEAVVVGLIAATLGLAGGIGIAAGLKVLFEALGVDLPSGRVVVTTTTVTLSFVVGLTVSVASAIVPALRASRVSPLAAMREAAVDRPRSIGRIVVGALVTGLGVALTANGLLRDVDEPLRVVGVGALALVLGVAVLGPLFAGPLSRAIGSPLPRLRGMSGSLARLNAARNPSRTSTTASALMIGVALVTFITIVAASFKASFEATLSSAVKGDFVVDSGQFGGGGGGLPPELARQLGELPEVELATGLRVVPLEVDGRGTAAIALDPEAAERLFDLDLVAGSYDGLDESGIAVFEDDAEERGLALGDPVDVRFAETGARQLTVRAVFATAGLAGGYVVGTPLAEANVADAFDIQVFVELAAGVDRVEARAALESVVESFPTGNLQDQDEYRDAQTAPIDQVLGLVYALLSFSVLIALIGIANTLALSVFERTRELGLLRAVGMTRPQLKSMVRWESVIIALLGTVLGLVLGAFFSWATITSLAGDGFGEVAIPAGSLALIAVVAALAGVWAARRPAKRASKLDVLAAIAST